MALTTRVRSTTICEISGGPFARQQWARWSWGLNLDQEGEAHSPWRGVHGRYLSRYPGTSWSCRIPHRFYTVHTRSFGQGQRHGQGQGWGCAFLARQVGMKRHHLVLTEPGEPDRTLRTVPFDFQTPALHRETKQGHGHGRGGDTTTFLIRSSFHLRLRLHLRLGPGSLPLPLPLPLPLSLPLVP